MNYSRRWYACTRKTKLRRFQNAEMSSLVIYAPYTKLSIKQSCVLARGEADLSGGNRT